jgi:cyclopropane fatty-acyl-phospholipid synthase-like methyltransferase
MSQYRDRIYEHYVSAHDKPLAPITIEGFKPREALMKKLISDHFPPDKQAKIVDLGCGHGTLVYFARQAGYQDVIGVDVSQQQVDAAHHLGLSEVQCGDLMVTLRSFPDRSQDVIVAFDVIEHFEREELLPFIDEVRRVLKDGGKWIIHVPNGESPFHGRVFYSDGTHEHAFTQFSIKQILLASGFSSIECYEDKPIAHGLKSGVRSVLWKGIRTVLGFCVAVESGIPVGSQILSQNLLAVARR